MLNDIKILYAIELATIIHNKQCRKVTRLSYITHPMYVMTLLGIHANPHIIFGQHKYEIAVAAILHDTVEDHPNKISFNDIENNFSSNIAEIVRDVTLQHNESKVDARNRIINKGYKTHLVKLADILANTNDTINCINILGLDIVQGEFKSPMINIVNMNMDFLMQVDKNAKYENSSIQTMVNITYSALEKLKKMIVFPNL